MAIEIKHPNSGAVIEIADDDFTNLFNWENAIMVCKELGDGWRLPDTRELELMYQKFFKEGTGNFKDDVYWSSSEVDYSKAHAVGFFHGGLVSDLLKFTHNYVRAVRDKI